MTTTTTPAVLVQREGYEVDYTPSADTACGTVVALGAMIGITVRPILANQLGSLVIDGVFDLPKTATEVYAVGDKLYWDVSTSAITSTASGNVAAGKCVKAALAADTTTRVKLLPSLG